MKKLLLCLLTLSVFLTGCATTEKMSMTDRQKVTSVSINANVKKASELYYVGPGAGIGMAFGPIGGAIAGATSASTGKSLQAFAEQNNIFIEKIVLEEFNDALRKSNKIPVVESPSQSAATLNISIIQYGFATPNILSSGRKPLLIIEVSMVDMSGKTIWKAKDFLIAFNNPAEAISLDDMKSNPKLIENSWRVAARVVIAGILKEL